MSGGQELVDAFADRIADYDSARNFPARRGTSHLSVHLRFGTVSVRCAGAARADRDDNGAGGSGAAVWLSELIWRDFYFSIQHHFPHVAQQAFKPEYDTHTVGQPDRRRTRHSRPGAMARPAIRWSMRRCAS